MNRHQYYSGQASKKSETWAEENSQFFSGLISRYQFARGCCNAGNSKAVIAAALANKSALNLANKPTAGWTKITNPETGDSARCQVLHAWHFQESITKRSKLYYCSAWNRVGMPYGDIDCHHSWQTSEMARQAQQIFQNFFPSLGLASDRGANNWLKLDRGSYSCEKSNLILLGDKDRGTLGLEGAMQRLLAAADCWADFEIKGTFAYLDRGQWQWGKYGKLPIHRPEWDRQKLQQLIDQPIIHIREIEAFIKWVERDIPQSVLDQMNAEKARRNADEPVLLNEDTILRIKKNWDDRWREAMHQAVEDEDGQRWLERRFLKPPTPAVAESPSIQVAAPTPPGIPTRKPADVRVNNVDLRDEIDSFRRQRLALMRFSRALCRLPNLNEALNHIHDQELFSGSWAGNKRRTKRIKAILKWLGRTFDASKIRKGRVQVGKHRQYVARKFPNGIKWGSERRWVNDEGNVLSFFNVTAAPAEFVSTFLDIVDYCLNDQPNANGHFPTERCKRLWNSLYDKEVISTCWCPRKFAACREYLAACGLFRITDRTFGPGKAMTWEVDRFFPGRESWKQSKTKQKPVTWSQFVAGLALAEEKIIEKQEEHNTLLHSSPVKILIPVHFVPPRGPP